MGILVIDIGTSSMRGVLFRENGEKILSKQYKYEVQCSKSDIVEQEASVFEDALYKIVTYIVSESKKIDEAIDVISVTGQRSAIMPVDENGKVLSKVIMWQDKRNSEICKGLEGSNSIILNKTGACINTIFSGSKMTWISENQQDIYEKVHKFLNIPQYIMFIMTGEYKIDYTYASRTSLMNIRECCWDEELLKLFKVKKSHLCDMQEPGSIIGKTNKEFSKSTGLLEGVPVISAGGDQQCAAIGQGVYKNGTMSITLGTGAFLIANSNKLPEEFESDVIFNYSSVKGKYIIESNVVTCCSAFNWFCNNFYGDNVNYEEVNKELESIYDEKGECLVLPYFQGRSTPVWNSGAQAVFSKISLSTRRKDILKGILEGILIEVNNNIKNLNRYTNIDKIYVSGGLTKSKMINQMQADIYGIPVYSMQESETTVMGALMVTMNKLCIHKTIEEAFHAIWAKNSFDVYYPRESKHEEYIVKQAEINELYDKIYSA